MDLNLNSHTSDFCGQFFVPCFKQAPFLKLNFNANWTVAWGVLTLVWMLWLVQYHSNVVYLRWVCHSKPTSYITRLIYLALLAWADALRTSWLPRSKNPIPHLIQHKERELSWFTSSSRLEKNGSHDVNFCAKSYSQSDDVNFCATSTTVTVFFVSIT